MKDVEDYINNVLDEKRPEFGGKRVCPFAAHELASGKLLIAELKNRSLVDFILDFKNSTYESAIVVLAGNICPKDTKKFQAFTDGLLSYCDMGEYKSICFNPNDMIPVMGYNPRSLSPGFMVNIAKRSALAKASRSLKKTNYYDKLPKDYLKFLNIKK